MTLNAQEKADLARYRSAKAESLLSDAKTLIEARSWSSSANRSYYAVLSAARALLALRVLQARRMDSDYADYIEITEEEARDSLGRAREFVRATNSALQEMLKAV